jgi:hypothetical protein
MRRFFHDHGLSVCIFGLFLVTLLVGQVLSGQRDYNDERRQAAQAEVGLKEYLLSPHFIEATAENWESEFLQMFIYVAATAFLYQKGSAESKDPRKAGREPTRKAQPDSPWPVRHGGWALKIYRHSLSLAFLFLFLIAFAMHAWVATAFIPRNGCATASRRLR